MASNLSTDNEPLSDFELIRLHAVCLFKPRNRRFKSSGDGSEGVAFFHLVNTGAVHGSRRECPRFGAGCHDDDKALPDSKLIASQAIGFA